MGRLRTGTLTRNHRGVLGYPQETQQQGPQELPQQKTLPPPTLWGAYGVQPASSSSSSSSHPSCHSKARCLNSDKQPMADSPGKANSNQVGRCSSGCRHTGPESRHDSPHCRLWTPQASSCLHTQDPLRATSHASAVET